VQKKKKEDRLGEVLRLKEKKRASLARIELSSGAGQSQSNKFPVVTSVPCTLLKGKHGEVSGAVSRGPKELF
jgi:hypothetical protein